MTLKEGAERAGRPGRLARLSPDDSQSSTNYQSCHLCRVGTLPLLIQSGPALVITLCAPGEGRGQGIRPLNHWGCHWYCTSHTHMTTQHTAHMSLWILPPTNPLFSQTAAQQQACIFMAGHSALISLEQMCRCKGIAGCSVECTVEVGLSGADCTLARRAVSDELMCLV